jgi:hypothetical protein
MDTIDWQTPAAAAVVALTAALFIVRSILRRRRFQSNARPCGTGCDCPARPPHNPVKN